MKPKPPPSPTDAEFFAPKPCNCIRQFNAAVSADGIELATDYFDANATNARTVILLPVRWIDPQRRGETPVYFANYCPLCGQERLDAPA